MDEGMTKEMVGGGVERGGYSIRGLEGGREGTE